MIKATKHQGLAGYRFLIALAAISLFPAGRADCFAGIPSATVAFPMKHKFLYILASVALLMSSCDVLDRPSLTTAEDDSYWKNDDRLSCAQIL